MELESRKYQLEAPSKSSEDRLGGNYLYYSPTNINKCLRSSGNVKQFLTNVKKNVAAITQPDKCKKRTFHLNTKEASLNDITNDITACQTSIQACKCLFLIGPLATHFLMVITKFRVDSALIDNIFLTVVYYSK